MVREDPGLNETQKREITASLALFTQGEPNVVTAAYAPRGKRYSQFTTGAAYTRTHNGKFYYNGDRVWVTQTVSGLKGSHSCFTNYTVGLSITGTGCSDTGGTTWRTLRDTWTVGWSPSVPFSYSVTMACTVYKNGTIAGPGATLA
jgi:hypothetical protein